MVMYEGINEGNLKFQLIANCFHDIEFDHFQKMLTYFDLFAFSILVNYSIFFW